MIYNDSNPVWDETFLIDLSRFEANAFSTLPHLHLEVWDHNNFTSNVFLGCCTVEAETYLAGKPQSLTLGPSALLNARENKHAKGMIHFSFGAEDESVVVEAPKIVYLNGLKTVVRVSLLRASIPRHPKVVAKKINPVVVLKMNGVAIGSTKPSSSLRPRWEKESFLVDTFSLIAAENPKFALELCSHDIHTNAKDPLGEFSIDYLELLHPWEDQAEREVEIECRLGEEETFLCTLVYKIYKTFECERLHLQPIRYDQSRFLSTSDQGSSRMELLPITDVDAPRGRRRIERYLQNPFQRQEYFLEDHYKQLVSANVSIGNNEYSLKLFQSSPPAEIIVFSTLKTSYMGRLNLVCRIPAGKLHPMKREFLHRINAGK